MPVVFYFLLSLTVCWFIFMTCLSHEDGEHTKETSERLAKKMNDIARNIERVFPFAHDRDIENTKKLNSALRKIAHTALFAVLAVLSVATLAAGGLQQYKKVVLLLLVFWSWMDEASKIWVEGRHFSWLDVMLNIIGVAAGNVLFLTFSPIFSIINE